MESASKKCSTLSAFCTSEDLATVIPLMSLIYGCYIWNRLSEFMDIPIYISPLESFFAVYACHLCQTWAVVGV